MTEKDAPPGRKLRADAARNRQLLLDVAYAVFAEKGSAASLEEIARTAGVGIGTLYRHFPTRDALVEEVYRSASDQLARSAEELAAAHPPVEALRQWLLVFVDYLATKKLMADALAGLVGGTAELYANSGAQIKIASGALIGRAVESGEIRGDIDPFDLLRALAGLSSAGPDANWQENARRFVDILIAGIRVAR